MARLLALLLSLSNVYVLWTTGPRQYTSVVRLPIVRSGRGINNAQSLAVLKMDFRIDLSNLLP